VVGALRIDQAWGYAQIAAALHDASGGYYGAAPRRPPSSTPMVSRRQFGFAVTGGFTLNDVFGMKGDQVGQQAAYSQGRAGYVTGRPARSQVYSSNTNTSAGFGWVTDGVFDTGTAVELTHGVGIHGFYQHSGTRSGALAV